MDIHSLPNKAISVQPSPTPLKAGALTAPTMTLAGPPASAEITITQAPSPEGYTSNELYVKHRQVTAFEHVSEAQNSILKAPLERKLATPSFAGYTAISGMLGQINGALTSGETEVNQVSSKTLFKTRIKEFDPTQHTQRIETRNKKISELEFELRTEQGDVVTFNILHDYTSGELAGHAGFYAQKNIAVNFSVSGELNEKEIEAINAFAKALDTQINRVDHGKEIDFRPLNIFADTTIAEVNVSLKLGVTGSEVFSLNLTNTDKERTIDYQGQLQKINLSLDNTHLFSGKPNSQQAIDDLLKSLEEGVDKAKDFTGKGKALVDAAKNLFSHLPINENMDATTRLGYSVTSGLPDFSMAYRNSVASSLGTIELVDLTAQQKTYFKQDQLQLDVRQHYDYEINYRYTEPLPHLDIATEENHIQTIGQETQHRRSVLTTNEQGEIVQAYIAKQASADITETEVRDGKQVRQEVKERIVENHKDLLADVRNAESQKKLLLVEGITEHLKLSGDDSSE